MSEWLFCLGEIIKFKRRFPFLLALIKGVANELLNRYNPTAVANLIPTELIYSILNYATLL